MQSTANDDAMKNESSDYRSLLKQREILNIAQNINVDQLSGNGFSDSDDELHAEKNDDLMDVDEDTSEPEWDSNEEPKRKQSMESSAGIKDEVVLGASGRGGKRPGAGRKRSGVYCIIVSNVILTFYRFKICRKLLSRFIGLLVSIPF